MADATTDSSVREAHPAPRNTPSRTRTMFVASFLRCVGQAFRSRHGQGRPKHRASLLRLGRSYAPERLEERITPVRTASLRSSFAAPLSAGPAVNPHLDASLLNLLPPTAGTA